MLPVLSCSVQCLRKRFGRKIRSPRAVDAQGQIPALLLVARKEHLLPLQYGCGLIAVHVVPALEPPVRRVYQGIRPVIAAFPDIVAHRREKAKRRGTRIVPSRHRIGALALLVPALIEGHGRMEGYAILHHGHPGEKAGHVPVVPDVVRAASVERDCRRRRHLPRRAGEVFQCHAHELDRIAALGYKDEGPRLQAKQRACPHNLIPKKTSPHLGLLVSLRSLLCRLPGNTEKTF